MTRIRRMFRRSPGKSVAALATLALAAAVAVGTGANFTAGAASPGNFVTSGALSMDNSENGTAVFTITGAEPNFTAQTGTVLFKNTGNVPGSFGFDMQNQTNTLQADDRGSISAGTVLTATTDANPAYSDTQRLGMGLRVDATKMNHFPPAGPATPVGTGADCDSLTNWLAGSNSMYLGRPDEAPAGSYGGNLNVNATGGPATSNGNVTLQPGECAAFEITVRWPTGSTPGAPSVQDATASARRGVRFEWTIHFSAVSV